VGDSLPYNESFCEKNREILIRSFINNPYKKINIGEQLISLGNPAIVLLGFVIVLAIISKTIQRKFIDKEKMASIRAQVREKQQEATKLLKEGKQDKAMEVQNEMLEKNMEMMQMTNKVMMFSLPIFLVFFWILGFVFGSSSFESLIPLPAFNGFSIINPASWIPVGITTTTGYYKAYFFYYLIITIILGIVEKIYDNNLKKILQEKLKK
jgi:uncharacterized membrane protein (DUF106 family)